MLTDDECLPAIQRCGAHRAGGNGRIEIFPVNYGMEGVIIVFRTSPGTKLDAVATSPVVFEADGWDRDSGVGWSVVARGRAEDVTTNTGRVAEHLRRVPVRPAAPGDRWHWVGIKPSELTGRRFHVPPAPRARE